MPERAPGALVADKAYDYDPIRDDLKQRGIRAVIQPKSNRTKTICYNKRLHRQRNCIDRVPKPAAELRTCADAPRSLHAIWRDSSVHL